MILNEPSTAKEQALLSDSHSGEQIATLVETLTNLLNDYLNIHKPDSYPQPMPEQWRVVQWYLDALKAPDDPA